MNNQNRKRPHINDNENDNGDKDNNNQADSEQTMDLLGLEGEGTSSNNNNNNANDLKELKLAAYVAKVQMLEAELKCAKMEAKMLELSLEKKLQENQRKMEKHAQEMATKMEQLGADFEKKLAMLEGQLREVNNSFGEKLQEAEQNAKKELEPKIQAIQMNMERIDKEMGIRNACQREEMKDLEMTVKDAEKRAKFANFQWITSIEAQQIKSANNLDKKMEYFKMDLKTLLEEKQPMEIAELKEQLKRQGIKLDQIKPDWGRLMKDKRLEKQKHCWCETDTKALISEDGLEACYEEDDWQFVYTVEGFCLSAQLCRKDNFPGIIIHYFEVTKVSSSTDWPIFIALSNGNNSDGSLVSSSPNCYAFGTENDYCWLSGKIHDFQWPNGAIKPEWNGEGDVVGCGLLLPPKDQVSIFFTANGILMGKQIPIDYPGDRLFPTVQIADVYVRANFGDNEDNPFMYDIDNCPGFIFDE